VQGPAIALFKVPAGYTFDGDVRLTAPLTTQTFPAEKVEMIRSVGGRRLKITFDKGLIDNNMPAGDAVPLTVSVNFLHQGVQKKVTSTTNVCVLK
jgi:quinohemoprotein ethanol dehydrogenase